MKKHRKILGIATSILILLTMPLSKVSAQYTGIEIQPDSYTVVLDHLNDFTVGEQRGTLNYVTGLPGLEPSGDFTEGTYIIYSASANLESQGTVELWLNPRMYGVGLVNFNWNYTYSFPPAGHVFRLILNSDGTIGIGGWSWSSCMFGLHTNSTIPLNEWTHIAVSWGEETKIYINGNVDVSTPQCFRPAASGGVWVYLHEWGDNDLGYVDEFHVSSIQRTDDEIRSRVIPLLKNIAVDIKPGSFPNSINLKSKGNVPVAILSDSTFDATTVDRSTVIFAGASPLPIGETPEDVNTDGLLDIVLHFKTQDLDLQSGDTEACLSGKTLDGQDIEGCDSVRIVK